MKTLQFVCELQTDVILNVKSASEGNNQTLDFIPGNVFLGVVASSLYEVQENGTNALMFHSGEVRFGDAHPLVNGSRSLRIPSEFFLDKLKREEGNLYVHCHMTDEDHRELRANGIQLKQCRTGFYIFQDDILTKCSTKKSFAIKSAHDSEKLTSKDQRMYGYESLIKGATYAFSVEIDEDSLVDAIRGALVGLRHIGRSRTAQYGLVRIKEQPFAEVESGDTSASLTTIYADGRLIFMDPETGLPSYQPTLEDLGIEAGTIRWDLSQVRTFQYAPWNCRRQAFDADRCGIEKGSVIVIENAKIKNNFRHYVGSYCGEGFGKIIYNPSFLNAGENGVSPLAFMNKPEINPAEKSFEVDDSTPLLAFLSSKKSESIMMTKLYRQVNHFYRSNQRAFKDAQFASQWGTIRSLAMQYSDDLDLYGRLFAEPMGYLVHGVAKDKWSERGRLDLLEYACKEACKNDIALNLFLINLASQMQKLYRNAK